MDIDFIEWDNLSAWALTLVMWGGCMLILWKMIAMGHIPTTSKIITTVVSFPLLFVIISWKLGSD